MNKMAKIGQAGILLAVLLCGCVARPVRDEVPNGFAPPPAGFLNPGAYGSGRSARVARPMDRPARPVPPVGGSGGFVAPRRNVPVQTEVPQPSRTFDPRQPSGGVYTFAGVEFDVRPGTGMVWVFIDGYRQHLPEGRTFVPGWMYGRGRTSPEVRYKVIDGKGRSLADGTLLAGVRRTVVVAGGGNVSVPSRSAPVPVAPVAPMPSARPVVSSPTYASRAIPLVQKAGQGSPSTPVPVAPVAVPSPVRPVVSSPAETPRVIPPVQNVGQSSSAATMPAIPVVTPVNEGAAASCPADSSQANPSGEDERKGPQPLPDRGYICLFNELEFVYEVYASGSRVGRRELLPGSLEKKLQMYSIEHMSWDELAERLHRLRRQTQLTEEQFAFFRPYWPE